MSHDSYGIEMVVGGFLLWGASRAYKKAKKRAIEELEREERHSWPEVLEAEYYLGRHMTEDEIDTSVQIGYAVQSIGDNAYSPVFQGD